MAPTMPLAVRQFTGDDPRQGPLPALLLLLTVVTGLVDAVSILELGRVFVANMTGNIVFTGFAISGAPGFSLSASLSALAGFMFGAGLGGQLIARMRDRAALLGAGATTELVLVLAACVLSAAVGTPLSNVARNLVAALLAVGMGVQNAVARQLAVPDMTTTVLTMTLTGIAADIRSRSYGPALVRRLVAVAAMLGGGVLGGWLVLHTSSATTLAVAAGLIAVVVLGVMSARRGQAAWRQQPS